jgi:hypothetical protein
MLEEEIVRTYTLYKNGAVQATGLTLDIVQSMQSAYPDVVTYAPTQLPFFKYDICFSTPLMNRQSAHDLIRRCISPTDFPAYTVYDGEGSWKGTAEPSYTFTCTQEEDDAAIDRLAQDIKALFDQEAVLVIKTPVTSWLV